MGDARRRAMAAFLDGCGWGGVVAVPLAGDASFRRYYRLGRNGSSTVLMDAPPPQEDVGPYVFVAGLLRDLGLSAPEVLAEDREEGFLLLEDFGDDTYTRLLDRGADEPALYALAVDTLVALQRAAEARASPKLPAYDMARLLAEAALLVDWYVPLSGSAARGILGALASGSAARGGVPLNSGAARLPRGQFDAAAGSPRGPGMRTARFPGRGLGSAEL